MNFDELKKRYMNDPEFYQLTKRMYHFLTEYNVNISTAKEALYLAALQFEEMNVRPTFMTKPL